jgi:hypothetical protein
VSGRGAARGVRRIPSFAEGPGAFLVSASAGAAADFGSAARVIGEVGGDTLKTDGHLVAVPRAALTVDSVAALVG